MLAPTDWSPDGKTAILTSHRQETGADIVLYSFETGEVEVYLETEHDEDSAMFSPDGRWVAYRSDETGRSEIYVAAYPGPGGKWQLSSDGGSLPVWRADGRELYYLGSERLMAVPVETAGAFRHDPPVPLFELPEIIRADWTWQTLDVTPDGRRFLLLVQRDDQGAGERTLTLVQGWRALID